ERRAALAAGSRPAIATSRIGVTIRDGAATPDIATPEAFRQALIDARRVAFSDAAVGGSAGVYLARLFKELGLADTITAKGMPQQSGGEVAARVAAGEADLGMTPNAGVVPGKGARGLGALPAPLGSDATYCAAVMEASEARGAAGAFIVALKRGDRRAAWTNAGFDPAS